MMISRDIWYLEKVRANFHGLLANFCNISSQQPRLSASREGEERQAVSRNENYAERKGCKNRYINPP